MNGIVAAGAKENVHNNSMKLENQMKERQIEELKKNVKMSKHRENENEV